MRSLEDIINGLDPRSLSGLVDHLLGFVNTDRVARIDRVLALRTRFLTVALENVYQAHNASAVVRSCDCFGVQDLHAIETTNRFEVHRRIVQGSAKWVSNRRYRGRDAADACLARLKQAGYRIIGMSPDPGSEPLEALSVDAPLALCFGSEEPGLSDAARSKADGFVSIPMQGFTQSLNLSVSAGIAIQHLAPRVRRAHDGWPLEPGERDRLRALWLARSTAAGGKLVRRHLGLEYRRRGAN